MTSGADCEFVFGADHSSQHAPSIPARMQEQTHTHAHKRTFTRRHACIHTSALLHTDMHTYMLMLTHRNTTPINSLHAPGALRPETSKCDHMRCSAHHKTSRHSRHTHPRPKGLCAQSDPKVNALVTTQRLGRPTHCTHLAGPHAAPTPGPYPPFVTSRHSRHTPVMRKFTRSHNPLLWRHLAPGSCSGVLQIQQRACTQSTGEMRSAAVPNRRAPAPSVSI